MSLTKVKSGAVLLKEEPFVYVLNSNLRTNRCDFCLNKAELLKCSNCQYVFYCGKICQKEGWPIHKFECPHLKKIKSHWVPDTVRLMARLIRKLQKGGSDVRSFYAANKYRTFKDLMSHYSDLKSDRRRMEHLATLCGVLSEFLSDISLPNSADLMGIYGRMCINSFSICDYELKSIGTGIYLAASIIDHSCEPNAVATFSGTTLQIRALTDINNFDWSNIFISYIDTLNTPKARQDELEMMYYFICKCVRCMNNSLLDEMYGAACSKLNCNGFINMYSINDIECMKCSKCASNITEEAVAKYTQVEELSKFHLNEMKEIAYLDICKMNLQKQKDVFYKFNINHVKMLDLAFESSIEMGQWKEAKTFGTELIDCYLFYYNKFNPMVGLLYLKLAKLLFYLDEVKQASVYLRNSFDILKITHGISNGIFKNELYPLMENVSILNGCK